MGVPESDHVEFSILVGVDDYLTQEREDLPEPSPRKAVMRSAADMKKMMESPEVVYKSRRISVVQLGRVNIEVPSLPAMVSQDSRYTTYGLLILHDVKDWSRC